MHDMKAVIEYALLVIGIPHVAGLLVGLPLALLFPRIFPAINRMTLFAILDIFNGLGCLFAGIAISRMLLVPTTLAIPLVLVVRSATLIFPRRGSLGFNRRLFTIDLFKLARLKYYDWSVNGVWGKAYRSGLILDYFAQDVPEAVEQGILRPEDAAWANETVMVASSVPISAPLFLFTTEDAAWANQTVVVRDGLPQIPMTRRQIAEKFIDQGAMFGCHWRFFDAFMRGLMVQAAVTEFVRLNAEHPKLGVHVLMRQIAKDLNNYFGVVGRQGLSLKQFLTYICHVIGIFTGWIVYMHFVAS
jgi:hypothetical protein